MPLSNLSTPTSVSETLSAAVLYISENVMSQCAPLSRDNNKVPKVQVTLLHYWKYSGLCELTFIHIVLTCEKLYSKLQSRRLFFDTYGKQNKL